jgi:hypothetical protein
MSLKYYMELMNKEDGPSFDQIVAFGPILSSSSGKYTSGVASGGNVYVSGFLLATYAKIDVAGDELTAVQTECEKILKDWSLQAPLV